MRIFLALSLCIFSLTTLLSFSGFAQSCNDGLMNGDEYRTDCGGSMCPECIPLWHSVECDGGIDGTGVYDISVFLPNYLWTSDVLQDYYYELAGDLSIECFALNECTGFSNYQEGNQAQVLIYRKSIPSQEVIGYGAITGELYCVKDLATDLCPDSLNFNVSATYEKIPLENSDSYMLKIEIADGTPPFAIKDNNTDDLYYKIGHPDYTPYYLGAIPNGIELDLDIVDIHGCAASILSIDDTTNTGCNAGYSISIFDSALDCEGNDLENGSIVLKDIGNCGHVLEFDGDVGDTIRGLAIGAYTFNVLNETDNTSESETRTITVGEGYTPMELSFTSFPPGVCGGSGQGSIEISMTGGLPPYKYKWSNCETGCETQNSQNDLPVGTYTVDVSDRYGCTKSQTIELISESSIEDAFIVFPTFHSEEAKLQFCLDSESAVTIAAYAANGQFLGTVLYNEVLSGGAHQIPSNTESFPVGVYFYTLEIEGVDGFEIVKTIKTNRL